MNPHEPTPTYIHVDSFKFEENPLVHSTLSHDISVVWVYYNGNAIGVFDLPATFPVVMKEGDKLELQPGIVIDGLNNLLGVYPFYPPDTSRPTPQPGKVITYVPKTRLYTNVKQYMISDFEGGAAKFALVEGNVPMAVTTDPSQVFEGGGSGIITLNAVTDSSADSSTFRFTIPQGAAFIEFDYKTDIPFAVGLKPHIATISATEYYFGGAKPNTGWQKYYLSVADFAAQYKGDTYTFFIKTYLGAGQTSGRLLIDNIKLLTF